jgi:hypothetical protein
MSDDKVVRGWVDPDDWSRPKGPLTVYRSENFASNTERPVVVLHTEDYAGMISREAVREACREIRHRSDCDDADGVWAIDALLASLDEITDAFDCGMIGLDEVVRLAHKATADQLRGQDSTDRAVSGEVEALVDTLLREAFRFGEQSHSAAARDGMAPQDADEAVEYIKTHRDYAALLRASKGEETAVVTLRVKSLDPEDRRILYENLWDLYVTDDGNLTGHTGEGT